MTDPPPLVRDPHGVPYVPQPPSIELFRRPSGEVDWIAFRAAALAWAHALPTDQPPGEVES